MLKLHKEVVTATTALGMLTLPAAAARAGTTEIFTSSTTLSRVEGCRQAMTKANLERYDEGSQTRVIGPCECEAVGTRTAAYGKEKLTEYTCAVRLDIREK